MKFKTLMAVLLLCFSAQAQTRQNGRKMAVTIDDLPYVVMEDAPYLPNAQRVTTHILRALQTYHVPVVGFVNEARLHTIGEFDARVALLQRWINAGAILGNHTYSHSDFNRLTIEQFEDEIVKGEAVTRRLMRSREPYQLYFRHPMREPDRKIAGLTPDVLICVLFL